MRNKNLLLLLLVLSSVLELTAQRRVLLEHYTSSWCGECPNAHLMASQIAEDYPDRVILAYHHSSVDPMANPHSTTWKDEFLIFGTPLGVINRTPPTSTGPIYASTSQWGSLVDTQLEEPDYLDLDIAFEPQPATGSLSFTVAIELLQELPGPGELRLSVIVVEDSIQSPEPGYQQSNYYNEVAGHPLFGQGGSIQMYPFMNVVRDIVDETWGSSAGLPDQPETGETYFWEGNFDLSNDWAPEHLRLIAVATLHNGEDIRSRPVLDARAIDIGDQLLTSTSSEAEAYFTSRAFPNPAQGYVQLNFPKGEYKLKLFDIQGKLIHAAHANGVTHTLYTPAIPKGIYMLLLVNTQGQSGAQQIIIR